MMRLYIIRHGETELNARGALQGQIDVPLNENGRRLAAVTGEALKHVSFDLVFSSPLSRAKETAHLVIKPFLQRTGKTIPFLEDGRLMEINWGEWEAKGCTEDNLELPREELNQFYSDPFHFLGAPGGETISQVCQRTGEFYQEMIRMQDYQDKTILISAHGCSVRGLLHQVYSDKNDF